MAALHKFNPVRLAYIRDRAAAHFGRDPTRLDSLAGLAASSISAVAAAFSPSRWRGLAPRWSAPIPSESNIAVARASRRAGRALRSITATPAPRRWPQAGERFDVVLAMEVVEHVADLDLFVEIGGRRW